MIRLLLVAALAACLLSCDAVESAPVVAIVGARLYNPPSPGFDHSVVIVRAGRIAAFGSQQETPVPAAAEKVNGLGKVVMPADSSRPLASGGPADLLLVSGDPRGSYTVERRMRDGQWVQR